MTFRHHLARLNRSLLSARRTQRLKPCSRRPDIESLEARVVPAVPMLLPAQVRHAYGVDSINFGGATANGAGQTIAIIDPGDDSAMVNSTSANFNTSDLAVFDASTGLPDPPSFTVIGETGGARPTYNASNIATATESGTTVTITTTAPHGFTLFEQVVITNVGVAGYNGSFQILSVTPTTFTYKDTVSGLANSTGGTATPQNPVSTGETALDVEWAHAMAPNANIVLIEMSSGIFGTDVANAIATAKSAGVNASVVSMSFGFGEFSGETGGSGTSFDDGLFTAGGVAYVASTGDTGEQGGYPAFSSNVLAVGATNLNLNPDNTYLGEKGWSNPPTITSATESGNTVTITTATATGLSVGNLTSIVGVGVAGYNGLFTVTSVASDTSFTYTDPTAGLAPSSGGTVFGSVFTDGNSGGSGGGISAFEAQPAYQQGTVTKVTQSTTFRTIPDVSLLGGAATPVEEYDSLGGGFVPTGGTSLAAPCWAGLVALADQGLALRGQPLFNTSTTLQTALYNSPLAFFHDITSGFNLASAGVGYDLVTGIGTPLANLLIPSLAGFAPVAVTSPGDQNSAEGEDHSFSLGSYIDYGTGPVKYDVSWGDSTSDLVVNTATTSASISANHKYTEEGTYPLTFTVTDVPTGQVASYTISITVSDPPVSPTGGFTVTSVEGSASGSQTVAKFTDPGGAEALGDYSATIDWGDGTPTSSGSIAFGGTLGSTTDAFTVTGSHTYAEESTADHSGFADGYHITVTIHHDTAVPDAIANSTATVTDPAVMATGGFAVTGKEGIAVAGTAVAMFTDPGGAEPVGDYSALVDFGDGQPAVPGTITFSGTLGSKTDAFTVSSGHTFDEEGSFTVTVTINHEESTAQQVSSTATIRDNYGLLLLDTTGAKSLDVSGKGAVTVNNFGAVVVDSSSPSAISLSGQAVVTTWEADVGLGGGAVINGQAVLNLLEPEFNHEAATPDPIALPLPPAPSTTFPAVHYSSSVPLTLSPGTYIGGITVSGKGTVILLPGVYYMKGGGFTVSGQGSVTDNGAGVLIVNAPAKKDDTINISGQASVSLTAPLGLTGAFAPYNGITIMQDPASANPISVSGQASLTMTGTLYAPRALLQVTGNGNVVVSPVALQPTVGGVVVVFDATVSGNGNLVINADPAPLFQLAAGHAAGLTADSTGLLASRSALRTGQLLVAVEDSRGAPTAAEQARIDDAIRGLNATLSPFGVDLVEASAADRSAATIHLDIASTTDFGDVAAGVLGVTENGTSITIVSGWNWYLGADPGAIGPNQYDFETVVAHELAHAVGLGEGSDPTSVMYGYLASGVARRALSASDLRVIDLVAGDGRLPAPADPGSGAGSDGLSAGSVPFGSGGNTSLTPAAGTLRADSVSVTDTAFEAEAVAALAATGPLAPSGGVDATPPAVAVAGGTAVAALRPPSALSGPAGPAVVIWTAAVSLDDLWSSAAAPGAAPAAVPGPAEGTGDTGTGTTPVAPDGAPSVLLPEACDACFAPDLQAPAVPLAPGAFEGGGGAASLLATVGLALGLGARWGEPRRREDEAVRSLPSLK